MQPTKILSGILIASSIFSCSTNRPGSEAMETPTQSNKVKLITLDPGHFHSALVQKPMYNNVDSVHSRR